jgi:copper homeostasis protein CutC
MGVGQDIVHGINNGNAVRIQTLTQEILLSGVEPSHGEIRHTYTSSDTPIYEFVKPWYNGDDIQVWLMSV